MYLFVKNFKVTWKFLKQRENRWTKLIVVISERSLWLIFFGINWHFYLYLWTWERIRKIHAVPEN